jgi:hypothetical protein
LGEENTMTDIEFAALAQGIARELGKLRGETWTAGPGWHSTQRKLCGPDEAELFISTDSWRARGKGRITAHGSYPTTNLRVHPEEITVAETRGAEAVAKEISRRLLPAYLDRLAEVREYNEGERAGYEARGKALNEVAARFGNAYKQEPYEPGRSNTYSDSFSLYHLHGRLYGSVEASGAPDTLRLDLHSVPRETGLRMLAVLAEDMQGDERP